VGVQHIAYGINISCVYVEQTNYNETVAGTNGWQNLTGYKSFGFILLAVSMADEINAPCLLY
jgi:hypothetical protein